MIHKRMPERTDCSCKIDRTRAQNFRLSAIVWIVGNERNLREVHVQRFQSRIIQKSRTSQMPTNTTRRIRAQTDPREQNVEPDTPHKHAQLPLVSPQCMAKLACPGGDALSSPEALFVHSWLPDGELVRRRGVFVSSSRTCLD